VYFTRPLHLEGQNAGDGGRNMFSRVNACRRHKPDAIRIGGLQTVVRRLALQAGLANPA
jgi:hypothetical protein